jgi:hypothetical protein
MIINISRIVVKNEVQQMAAQAGAQQAFACDMERYHI